MERPSFHQFTQLNENKLGKYLFTQALCDYQKS